MQLPKDHKFPKVTNDSEAPSTLPPVVDIHSHCLPGLDDGPADMHAALELCRQMVAGGTSIAIATPHQLGPYERRNLSPEIRGAVEELSLALSQQNIALKVVPGAEVRIDGRMMQLLENDSILTLGDHGRHLLLELPSEPLMDLRPVISLMDSRKITLIIAHPERQRSLRRRLDVIRTWAELGVTFQVNAASLCGNGGPGDFEMAWSMVDAGLIDFVASDCHDIVRRPSLLANASKLLMNHLGYSVARRICSDNPQAVLRGEPIRSRRSPVLTGVFSGVKA